jgi:tetratricopeptide (TPR) repeat protein
MPCKPKIYIVTFAALLTFLFIGPQRSTADEPTLTAEQQAKLKEAQDLINLVSRKYLGTDADQIEKAKQALKLREEVLGPDSPHVAFALDLVARIHQAQQQYDAAEPFFKRALAIYQKANGDEHDTVVVTRLRLAELNIQQKKFAEAEGLYRILIKLALETRGADDPNVVAGYRRLGDIIASQNRAGEAESFYKLAIKIDEQSHGPEHEFLIADCNALAQFYINQKRLADAETCYARALRCAEKSYGAHDYRLVKVIETLAAHLEREKKIAEAEAQLVRILRIHEDQFQLKNSDDHGVIYMHTMKYDKLAQFYMKYAMFDKSVPLYQHSLELNEKVRPTHRVTGLNLLRLGGVYLAQKKYAEAQPLYERSLKILEPSLDHADPNFAACLRGLAKAHREQGRAAEADALDERAANLKKPPETPSVNTPAKR